MPYTKFQRVIKNGRHLIQFESVDEDRTGLGGKWEGSGIFAEIFQVGKYFVLQDVLKNKPLSVLESINEIDEFLNGTLKNYGTESKTTSKINGPNGEAAPIRLLSLSGGDFGD
jgi:hypothetical protein